MHKTNKKIEPAHLVSVLVPEVDARVELGVSHERDVDAVGGSYCHEGDKALNEGRGAALQHLAQADGGGQGAEGGAGVRQTQLRRGYGRLGVTICVVDQGVEALKRMEGKKSQLAEVTWTQISPLPG